MSQKTIFQQFLWGCQAENWALRITHWLTAPHLTQKNFFCDISIVLFQNSKKLLEKKIFFESTVTYGSINEPTSHWSFDHTLTQSTNRAKGGQSHFPFAHNHISYTRITLCVKYPIGKFSKKKFFFLRFLH